MVVERTRNAGGDDEDAGDLDEHLQSIRNVVVVVGGGEPREVHPGPPDREEDERVGENALADLTFREVVVETRRRRRDRDDEAEVEQELERRGDAVRLARIASGHLTNASMHVQRAARRVPLARDDRFSGRLSA